MIAPRRLLLLLLLLGSTACVGPLQSLEPLRPLAPQPVCTNTAVPVTNADGTTSNQAKSECSVSVLPRR